MTLSLLKANLEAALLADGWDPESVTANCFEQRNWHCKFGHKWSTTVVLQVKNPGCPLCHGREAPLPVDYFEIENLEFLKKFVDQSHRSVTDTSQFPKDLDGLRIVISFAESHKIRIPRILFTDKGKDLSRLFTSLVKHVFPVYLFFPESNKLFLGLWNRATPSKLPSMVEPLGISFPRISSYVQDPLLYGNSFVFQTYTPVIKGEKIVFSRDNLVLDDWTMRMELQKTLNIYSKVSVTSHKIKSLFPFLRDDEVMLVSIQILNHAAESNIDLDEQVSMIEDLDVSKEALKYSYFYTQDQGECVHNTRSCPGLKNARHVRQIDLWQPGLFDSGFRSPRLRKCHWCQGLLLRPRERMLKFMAKTLQDIHALPPHQPTNETRAVSHINCAFCGDVANTKENWCPTFGSTERCPIFRK